MKRIPFEDFPAVLRAASVCVIPTRREGLGLIALEALALQKPVVATDTEGINEIIENGQNGYLYKDNEVGHLALKILELLRNPHKRAAFGRKGNQTVAKKFSAEEMALKHLELYRSLAESQPPTAKQQKAGA